MFQSWREYQNMHILCFSTFFQKWLCLWDNMEKYGRTGQATDDNIVQCMRLACLITEVTNTHTQNMYYLLFFHNNRGHTNMPQCYIIHTLPGLFEYETVEVTLSTVLLLEWLLGLLDECWIPRRGFTVLAMGNMKTLVFWVVLLCIVHLVPLFQKSMLVSSGWKEVAGTRFLQNVVMLSDYKVLHPRRHNCCLEDRVSKFLWNVSTFMYQTTLWHIPEMQLFLLRR